MAGTRRLPRSANWFWAMPAELELSGAYSGLTPWARHLMLLALATMLLVAPAWADLSDVVAIWSRTGAFRHCVLIPFILLWLVWQRRALLTAAIPRFSLGGAALVLLGGLIWLAGAAGYIALLRQVGLLLSVQGLVIALLGNCVARILAFPLCYAVFLIPAGSEFEPWLQVATARIAVALLHLTGTPALLEGVFIETPAGLFRVAEACSGTGFLLAMAAYATLVASLCFKSWRRRFLFLSAAMAVALLTNGLRAFVIMKLADLTSIRNPVVQDHLLLGWLLFAVVLGLLMMAASRWFERPDPIDGGNAGRSAPARQVLPAVVVAMLLPHLWLLVTQPVDRPVPPPVAPLIAGWTLLPGAYRNEWQPHYDGATWIGQWRYRRSGGQERVDLAIILYGRQEEGRELVGFGQGAVMPGGRWAVMDNAVAPSGARGEWLRDAEGRLRYVATFYLVNGRTTGDKIGAKLAAIRARLTGGDQSAAAILLSTEGRRGESEPVVTAFLHASGSAQEMADRAHDMR